jgi:hypothetical protein
MGFSGHSFVSRWLGIAQFAFLAVAVASCRGNSAALAAAAPPAVPVEIEMVRSSVQRDSSEYVASLISDRKSVV